MIGFIEGTIKITTEKYVIVSTGGVGYKIFGTTELLSRLHSQKECALFTHLAVREDALDLYGFETESELSFFELLISVSGIGPRSALGILGIAAIETLEKAIATGDTGYLTKVSGIGRKTAEKIVLELRDKMHARSQNGNGSNVDLRGESDAVLALQSLGYSQTEAREALKNLPPEITGTNERIKEALKMLGK
jgi:Holliday junction DNA helicase RuvA